MSEISEEPQPEPGADRRCRRSRRRSRKSRSTRLWSESSWARRTTSRRCSPPAPRCTRPGIRYEVRVMSAHRDPELVREYCHNARMRGLRVIIAGAGMSAALPGVAAAHTDLPVIGVPILGKSLGGLDALLSAVQMPPGIPVACVAIDGAKNAGAARGRGSSTLMIPRYTRPEIGAVWSPQREARVLARGRAGGDRGLGRGGRGPGRGGRGGAANAAFTVEAVNERERITDHDVAAFVDVVAAVGRRARALDPLRAHLLRRARHGAGAAAAPGRRDPPRRRRAYRDALIERALEHATRSASAAPTASTPSRRPSACGSPASPSRPTATSTGSTTPSSSSPSASSPAPSAPTPRCRPRSRRG